MDETKNNEIIEETTETAPSVPYIVFESTQARAERKEKRLIGVIILLVILFAASNAMWLYEWMSYDYVSETTTITQDTESAGNNNYIGNDGDIVNGKTDNKDTENIENETRK